MILSKNDKNNIVDRYTERYHEHGYSPLTLGWNKGKQDLRFDILTSQQDLTDKKIIDIGCGFGDLNKVLHKKFNHYFYFGVDVVPDLIKEARCKFPAQEKKFLCADFLEYEFSEQFDYAIASGIFNFKLNELNNYIYIENVIQKAMRLCSIGIAFDFLSDRVDYQYDHTFHSTPMKILEIAYKYSRNIVLRNDYMPFEFSIFIFKNDSFKKEDTVFVKKPKDQSHK